MSGVPTWCVRDGGVEEERGLSSATSERCFEFFSGENNVEELSFRS